MTSSNTLYVLIACEQSQAECMAFRALGHVAFSCDIQPCRPSGHPEWHIQGDVTPLLYGFPKFTTMDDISHYVPRWDLIIAHPPCTYLCKAGAIHMRKNGVLVPSRYALMTQARAFFFRCLHTNAANYVAVENPLPMAIARLPQPSCYADPSWFSVKYTKKTLYWLRNLPPLMPVCEHPSPKCYVRASRGRYRSRTFPAMAAAIADQWAAFILREKAVQ